MLWVDHQVALVVCRTDKSIFCTSEALECRPGGLRWAWIPEGFFFASTFFGMSFLVGSLIPKRVPTSNARSLPFFKFFCDRFVFLMTKKSVNAGSRYPEAFGWECWNRCRRTLVRRRWHLYGNRRRTFAANWSDSVSSWWCEATEARQVGGVVGPS